VSESHYKVNRVNEPANSHIDTKATDLLRWPLLPAKGVRIPS
jgi:hypothetical protein